MLGQYNAPRTYPDIVMLRKHLMMIQGIIEAEFAKEMPNMNPFIKSFPVKEQQVNYETVEADIKAVIDQINKYCSTYGKNYLLDLEVFNNL